MDEVEENLFSIFGREEAEEWRREQAARPRERSFSRGSDATFRDSEVSDADSLDRTHGSESEESEEETPTASSSSPNDWVDEPLEPTSLPLLGNPGIRIPNAARMSPLEYLKVFFNISFMSMLAEMTNQHASEVISRGISAESRLKRWKDTDAEELLTFLGVLFFMGTVRLNKINDYWAKSHLFKFNLTQYISRNRFLLILRMLYFQHRNAPGSMYAKVEELMNYFNSKMKEIVYPEKEMTIDESMVLFRGRLLIRQYIKNKRHKFGIKLYVLADPKGLVHRVHMYKGSADTEVGGQGHVKKVVLKLFDDYLDAGHSLYMDNFYNSVDLAETLLTRKTYCTGTLLNNRKGNPAVVTSKKLARGGMVYRKNGKGVCVMKWKDKRDVLTLSTEHTPDLKETINRRGRAAMKPNIIIQYNKFMKGVDRHDQMLSYYPCAHKTIRWYKKIGIHMFQMMMVNAFFLYKAGTGKTLSLESFREKVLSGLLPPKPRTLPPQFPTHMPKELERNGNGVLKRRKCSRCWSMNKKRKDSGMFCPDCNVGLCITCYGPYHVENSLLP